MNENIPGRADYYPVINDSIFESLESAAFSHESRDQDRTNTISSDQGQLEMRKILYMLTFFLVTGDCGDQLKCQQ